MTRRQDREGPRLPREYRERLVQLWYVARRRVSAQGEWDTATALELALEEPRGAVRYGRRVTWREEALLAVSPAGTVTGGTLAGLVRRTAAQRLREGLWA